MKPRRVWDNYKHLGEVLKSDRTKLVFELVARDGVKYLNIREWYCRKTDNVWRPSLKGLSIPIAIPVGDEIEMPVNILAEIAQEAIDLSSQFAIQDEENEVWWPPKGGVYHGSVSPLLMGEGTEKET